MLFLDEFVSCSESWYKSIDNYLILSIGILYICPVTDTNIKSMNRTARDYAGKEAGRLTARKAASKPGKRSLKKSQKPNQ